jgi:hypothetical protein
MFHNKLNSKFQINRKITKQLLAASLLVVLVSPLVATPAPAAEKGYRYWGYFQAAPKATTWTTAMTSAAVNVKDGAVEGWAFTFSSEAIPDASTPSVLPDFESLCAKKPAVKGKKRIGVVIDFGPSYLVPSGERRLKTVKRCVVISPKAQGIDVLGKVARVRADKSGLICGLAGYPRQECGVEITTPTELLTK